MKAPAFPDGIAEVCEEKCQDESGGRAPDRGELHHPRIVQDGGERMGQQHGARYAVRPSYAEGHVVRVAQVFQVTHQHEPSPDVVGKERLGDARREELLVEVVHRPVRVGRALSFRLRDRADKGWYRPVLSRQGGNR